ncbi:hypothetical protein PHET_12239 [Paragonimus heterotremus]|uniref:Uncharacterized protein n=1 Tax=Paragonimus heterotremus TaxID=100268 RepID=A0A8J4SSS3_9TREM|nr:hypothetical protein PHET_12239 [Paragonimus heterotremus]
MMGFPPRGIPILNSVRYSTLPVVISHFNCTGRVKLPSSKPNDIPEECSDKQRQTSIFCIDSMPVLTTTTSPPNLATIPPVDCKFFQYA